MRLNTKKKLFTGSVQVLMILRQNLIQKAEL